MQEVIVTLTVVAAATHAAWHLMPADLRRALIRRISGVAPRVSAASQDDSPCGGCKGCGSGHRK